ncbi:DUF2845 domain-containing protein [Metapseudomonas furukawaii]|jgi:hypothetical protein|uniref:DUF2845 domain-containing protein n=1 Tax=Metapseudomonas furukawaii TaxID=1149133 RepID=A0AAD1FIH2_METFU|nr:MULTISPECIES: DUF2845 domain-containing protein [Pseudomonas]ELS29562.1 Hypothetical protein ppKF707_6143 [Pseudomonas furukawaii]OWJ98673.1 hypothetical protein B6S59_00470 [Pseudomonas sp. A46]WAG78311.1 DUF2845 domain-containing protein [Pseudomonas furukawaii]BAU76588.1 hypothetical protein KF707C_49000 [Pseudomonas furukawaii]
MTMRNALAAVLLTFALATPAGADTMRCGSRLISLGDRAFEVLQKCGEPAHRDQVGYTLGGYDRREFTVEEWVYGPNNGMLSILTFEGNRLVRIETRRSR